jgi:UDP:flavonoid glycosyltransferase YjiC (YdhE family)
VLVTLGTHLAWAKAEAASALRVIAERERQWVFHFSAGDAGGAPVSSSGEFFRLYPYVPYDSWLGKFDVVLHHGGAGVMYECIKAARPSLVWPVDYDQFDHAARIERAGVGRRLRRWSDLPAALAWTQHDPELRTRCAEMQAQFHAYRPEEELRTLVERL